MLRSAALTAAALVATAVVSGCAQIESGGTPAPEPTSPATEDQGPKISNPKNLAAVSDPCALLRADQVEGLGSGLVPEQDTAQWGDKTEAICLWGNSDLSISLEPNTVTDGGFAQVQRNKDSFDNYAEVTVDTYPAAKYNSNELLCRVTAGVSEEDTLTADVAYLTTIEGAPADPCALATTALSEALQNVPAQP